MNLKLLLPILALAMVSFQAQAYVVLEADTNDTGFFEKSALPAKMLAAKHEFNERNMRGALTIYREILQAEPDNSSAQYWTARCHYELKRYDLAIKYLDKAVEIDPKVNDNVDFFYGKIHHRLAELDLAIDRFQKFLDENGNKSSFDVEEARRFIAQCKYAREIMARPHEVSIENMGPEVNSRFDEYAPSVTAKGDKLFFTSRRSNAVGGEIDEGGDYKFYEDVYYTMQGEDGVWLDAEGVNGEVNTPTYDAVLSISPDGTSMFIYRNNQNSAGDIFISGYDKHEDSWRAPEKMDRPVNTSYFESSVSITADGETLYFISERPEGQGQGDIYVAKKSGQGWGKPKNLGEVINTELDEKFVFIHPSGKTLYFASNGHQTMGSYDIFRTEFVNGQWSIPVNLGFPINTVNEESTFSLTRDNKTMYIAAEYDDALGERDIYQIDVSKYRLISEGYSASNYGTIILTVQDSQGNNLKGAQVDFMLENGDRVIASEKTDKLGRVRVNLPGGVHYKAIISSRKSSGQISFEMILNEVGETVMKETIKL
ncbi:MAG: tetratricopeptide repeat protein [Flavobacteriales bacterium]|nr:tetratricopeptide repeat protein [Flavobacteriales bacterium]